MATWHYLTLDLGLAAGLIVLGVALLTGLINAWFHKTWQSFGVGFLAGLVGGVLGFVLAPLFPAAPWIAGAIAGAISSGLLSGLNGDSWGWVAANCFIGFAGGGFSTGAMGALPWEDLALEIGAALAGQYGSFVANAFIGFFHTLFGEASQERAKEYLAFLWNKP